MELQRVVLGVVICTIFLTYCILPVTSFYVWPKPYSISQGTKSVGINPAYFTITTNSESPILHDAIHRYLTKGIIFPFSHENRTKDGQSLFTNINIKVNSSSEELQLGVNENYTLSITENASTGSIEAETIYGALRGLESFSQLVDWDDDEHVYSINCLPVSINDAPRFPWRGLLIDTSRHYLDPAVIFRAIDALSYSKFNTLHWHATDAQSFPIVVEEFPLLSQKGAYAKRAIYPPKLVQDIIQYGKSRGIRVVPEFDMPGHSYCWGKGYPGMMSNCPQLDSNIYNVLMNPSVNETYEVITGVLQYASETFIDNYIHIGGDEVTYGCWYDDPQILQWMKDNGISDGQGVYQYFETTVSEIFASNFPGKTPIVWEDVFDDGLTIPKNYLIEVWSDPETLQAVLLDGFNAISGYGWYLDQQTPLGEETYQWINTWQIFYGYDPFSSLNVTQEQYQNILGGEGCMWGEAVNSANFDSRVWPRGCAIGERLWSQSNVTDIDDATERLIEHSCRIARRGIGAGPIYPDWCAFPWSFSPDL